MKGDVYLEIIQCPVHQSFYGVAVSDKDGSGTRVTPSKCCGQWKTIKRWKLSAREWVELEGLCAAAVEELEKEEASP